MTWHSRVIRRCSAAWGVWWAVPVAKATGYPYAAAPQRIARTAASESHALTGLRRLRFSHAIGCGVAADGLPRPKAQCRGPKLTLGTDGSYVPRTFPNISMCRREEKLKPCLRARRRSQSAFSDSCSRVRA